MLTLDPYLLLVLVACLFVLVFGGLSLLRRQGLSAQFALESIALTVLLVGGSWLLSIQLSPFVLLILLYLVTMRSRLLVDLANMFAARRNYDLAFRLYRLSLAWWPDDAARLIVLTNRGAAEVHRGQFDAAIETLQGVLDIKTTAIAAEFAVGLYYTMARNHNRYWICSIRRTDSAHGTGIAQFMCDLSIRFCDTIGDFTHVLPN